MAPQLSRGVLLFVGIALLATGALAQDATPASMRRLARCWDRWASHTPPPYRQGYCDLHGLDCVDRPAVDPADTALARCATREHAPPPTFASTLAPVSGPTAASARSVACCLREHASLRAAATTTAPSAGMDVVACSSLATLTPSEPDASARLPHGAQVWTPAAAADSVRASSVPEALRADGVDLALDACRPASGLWRGWFYVACTHDGCAATLMTREVPVDDPGASGQDSVAACIERALASAQPGARDQALVVGVIVGAP